MKSIPYLICFFAGMALGAGVVGIASDRHIETVNQKWKTKMVDCGCAAYDQETGAWYAIETAPAPEPAPAEGPEYKENEE